MTYQAWFEIRCGDKTTMVGLTVDSKKIDGDRHAGFLQKDLAAAGHRVSVRFLCVADGLTYEHKDFSSAVRSMDFFIGSEPDDERARRRAPFRNGAAAIILSLMLFAGTTCAAEPPDSPTPKADAASVVVVREPERPRQRVVDKAFILTFTVLSCSTATDMVTTRRMLDRGHREANPLFGQHPSNARFAGVAAGTFGAEIAGAWFLKRYGRHHRWARFLWVGEPAFGIIEHARLAAANERLP